ncbi:MAG: response regulator [Deltaproteobacteria bacterium]|nr:response regulator [Deltaproteobacteria bacterium]
MLSTHSLQRLNRPTVFFFDDEENAVKSLGRQLRKEGFLVHTAHEKRRTMHCLNNNIYDVYCVDIQTPWSLTYGIQLIKKIREKNPHAFIDIVSAHREYSSRIEEIGADHFTEKPIDDIHEYANNLMENIYNKLFLLDNPLFGEGSTNDLNNYILRTINVLKENPEIRTIMLEIFGKELPVIKHQALELEKLANISKKYMEGSQRMIKLANNIIGDIDE